MVYFWNSKLPKGILGHLLKKNITWLSIGIMYYLEKSRLGLLAKSGCWVRNQKRYGSMQTIESIEERLNPFDKIQKNQNKDDPNNRPSCKSLLKHQNRSMSSINKLLFWYLNSWWDLGWGKQNNIELHIQICNVKRGVICLTKHPNLREKKSEIQATTCKLIKEQPALDDDD